MPKDRTNYAMLIDADNARATHFEGIMAEMSKYGTVIVKRAYGDWTTTNLNSWKKVLHEHAIQPIQQFAYTRGKNATDSAMIIDAMDLMYTEKFDGFCIVSSDCDFTRLATRLREAGMHVIGMGEKKTPRPFVTACDKFIYVEIIGEIGEGQDDEPAADVPDTGGRKGGRKPAPSKAERAQVKPSADLRMESKLVSTIRDGIDSACDGEGWANLGAVGQHVSRQWPDFDSRNYGFKKLSGLIEAIGLFEVDVKESKEGSKDIFIRDKRKQKGRG